MNLTELANSLTNETTQWIFNQPSSPHIWLVVGSNDFSLDYCPLTPLESAEDEALTPIHFLVGSSSGAKPLGECSYELVYCSKIF